MKDSQDDTFKQHNIEQSGWNQRMEELDQEHYFLPFAWKGTIIEINVLSINKPISSLSCAVSRQIKVA